MLSHSVISGTQIDSYVPGESALSTSTAHFIPATHISVPEGINDPSGPPHGSPSAIVREAPSRGTC